MDDPARQTFREDMLSECRADYVGLWEFLWEARRLMPEADQDPVRAAALDLIRELLEAGQIVAGDPTSDRSRFVSWNLSVPETMDRIKTELAELGRDPVGGEIVWFTTPD
jgi:hypothetical protein